MVNQTSLTGESAPVRKAEGSFAYAGTVLEEGELTVKVKEAAGSSRYEKIVNMIEDSEKLKSSVESNAEHLADRLVPYTLAGTGITYLLTRNMTKTLAVLMVDFSCALKLSMPIAVLSAMRECSAAHVRVKGGRFLEAVANADTIVFDKTGTLTYASPKVVQVVPFGGKEESEMLRLAACLEEHYPHSLANAVVEEARSRGLNHEEYHSQVEYVVAHGISSMVEGRKVVIGSYHFVFEDEGCRVPVGEDEKFASLPEGYSPLYLAVSEAGVLFILWFGAKNVRCLSVTPGNFDTPMGALESGQSEVFIKYSALKRNGKPEEIAALFTMLLDERLGFLTGADIIMDGGVIASGASGLSK